MAMRPLSEMVEAANAAAPAPEMNIAVGAAAPRYELYHFALSLCSQKVRATLAEAGVSYVAHDVNADPGNYHPDYIRLRLMGVEGRGFATGYTGRTAVGTEGVDPLVVPTLVDLSQERVVIDSRVICNHIAQYSAPHLVPAALEAAISHELDIIDGTPHVAMLYGAHPEHDFRPERIRKIMPGMHDRRIEKLTRLMSETADDAAVAAAFAAKIEKENAGRGFVHTPEAMRAAVGEMVDIVAALDARLGDGRGWICGDQFTLADVLWAVSLFRMKWIGMAWLWAGDHPLNATAHPRVAAYAAQLFERPAFGESVIYWPGVPRSEFVAEYYDD